MKKYLILAAVCLAAALTQAAPYLAEQMQLHVTLRPYSDLGALPNSTFNPRFFDGDIYANQINHPCFGRYTAGSGRLKLVVNNTNNPAREHRMVSPFAGAYRSIYLLGSSSAAAPATTFTRYDFDGMNPVTVNSPDNQIVDAFDWADETTIIYADYTAEHRNRLYLANVVAEPFSVTRNTRWNVNGYVSTDVSARIRNVRMGDVHSGYAYYGDGGQNNNPNFYALDLATGTSTLLGSAGSLTGAGSFGLWTVLERGGYLYVQTTDNGVQVYNMANATTLGSLYTTYTKAELDTITRNTGAQYYGLDVTADGTKLLLGAPEGNVFEFGPPLPAPVSQAAYVIHISMDALRPDAMTTLGPANLPNFYRMRAQGAFTDNARADYDYTLTLPNHTSQLTGRGVLGATGHGWNTNIDPKPGQTLASNKGSYVASAFDVAHDHGLRTGAFPSKSKFSIFDTSWNAAYGALDVTGPDHGRGKIDTYLYVYDTAALVDALATNMTAQPFHYAFIHFRDPDTIGETKGFNLTMGSEYCNTVMLMDSRLGVIFNLVDNNPELAGRTAIILTADHGGYDKTHSDAGRREAYTVPFYVWGPGVLPGADLYTLNPATRLNPGTGRPLYSAPVQPIRNGEAANVGLSLLGLVPVPGSTLNYGQNLALAITPPSDFQLTPVGVDLFASFTLVANTNVRHDIQSCDHLLSNSWRSVVTNIAGAGGMVTNINVGPATAPERYYRLKLHF